MDQIKGVDFSHWQGNVAFDKLAANGIAFAFFKAGEIPTASKKEFQDEMYARNISEARRFGIISGAYYFFHPSMGAARQARHFDTIMKTFGFPDLPPVIDIEDTDKMKPDEIAAELKSMSDALVGRGYRVPIIYSRWGYLVNQAGEPFWIKNHLLWLAQYNTTLTSKPADMSNVIIWQYTDKLKLPGIGVALDGNYWLKSKSELVQLANRPEPNVEEPPLQVTNRPEPDVDKPQLQMTSSPEPDAEEQSLQVANKPEPDIEEPPPQSANRSEPEIEEPPLRLANQPNSNSEEQSLAPSNSETRVGKWWLFWLKEFATIIDWLRKKRNN